MEHAGRAPHLRLLDVLSRTADATAPTAVTAMAVLRSQILDDEGDRAVAVAALKAAIAWFPGAVGPGLSVDPDRRRCACPPAEPRRSAAQRAPPPFPQVAF